MNEEYEKYVSTSANANELLPTKQNLIYNNSNYNVNAMLQLHLETKTKKLGTHTHTHSHDDKRYARKKNNTIK